MKWRKSSIREYLVHLKKILEITPPMLPLRISARLLLCWLCSFRFDMSNACLRYARKKHRFILDYLEARYANLLPTALTYRETSEPLPIWVFWYQGKEAMPPLVQMCYRSVLRHSHGRPVHLLHKDNMLDFVEIPAYVLDKVERRQITIAQLSDILRVSLLAKYGGHWLDATLYINSPLVEDNLDSLFQSIKMTPLVAGTISDYRWSGFCLYAKPHASTMCFFRDVLLAYWREDCHKHIIDYFLIDYTFQMLYENNGEFKELVDNRPPGNVHTYSMVQELNHPLDLKKLKEWEEQQFFKLNWRLVMTEGEDTLFHYLNKDVE